MMPGFEEERQVRTRADAGPGVAPVVFPQKPAVLVEKPHFEEKLAATEEPLDKKLLKKIAKQKKKQKKLEQEQAQAPLEKTPLGEAKVQPQFNRISRKEHVTEIQEVTIPIRKVIIEEPAYQVTLPPKHVYDDGELEQLMKDVSITKNLPPKTLDPVEQRIMIKRKLFIQPIVHHTREVNEVESTISGEIKQIIEGPCFTELPAEERWLPNLYEERHEFVKDKLEVEKQISLTKIDKTSITMLDPSHQMLEKPRGTETLPGMFVSASEDEMFTATVERPESEPAQKPTQKQHQKGSKVERQPLKTPTETETSIEQMSSSEAEPPHGMTLSDIAS